MPRYLDAAVEFRMQHRLIGCHHAVDKVDKVIGEPGRGKVNEVTKTSTLLNSTGANSKPRLKGICWEHIGAFSRLKVTVLKPSVKVTSYR